MFGRLYHWFLMTCILPLLGKGFRDRAIDDALRTIGADCQHAWEVHGVATRQGCLELSCRRCGLPGAVHDPSAEEWGRALGAPSAPYPWTESGRVTTAYASTGQMLFGQGEADKV